MTDGVKIEGAVAAFTIVKTNQTYHSAPHSVVRHLGEDQYELIVPLDLHSQQALGIIGLVLTLKKELKKGAKKKRVPSNDYR